MAFCHAGLPQCNRLLEVLLAAGIFWLLPAAVPRRAGQLIAPGGEQKIAPLILSDRLEAAATALREVSSTTREVADHLQKSTAENPEMLFDRQPTGTAKAVCTR